MNPPPLPRLKSLRWPLSRAESALALLVVGTRLSVFAYAGSPLPYYDQWMAEFNNLFLGVFTGQGFGALLDYHNEHWLVTTKVLSLLGFLFNGYWDVSFLIVCSALVKATTAVWTFRLIAPADDARLKGSLWAVCAGFFVLPISGYNLLSGMQVSFFLTDCALLWSLHTLIRWKPGVISGLSLVGAMIFGVASMGSAIAIPAATLIAHLTLKNPRPGFWSAWTVTAAIATAYVGITMAIQSVPALHGESAPATALLFWLRILAWPTPLAGIGALLLGGVGWLFIKVRRSAGPFDRATAILLGIGVYAAANAAVLAAARAPGSLHMRHWDTIGWVAFAALALGLHMLASLKWPRRPVLAATAIGLLYAGSLAHLFLTVTGPYLRQAHTARGAALAHHRDLLLTGDLRQEAIRMNALLEKKDLHFFDDPIGRYHLHPIVLLNLHNMRGLPLTLLAPDLIPTRPPSLGSRALRVLIDWSWLLTAGGLLAGMSALTSRRRELPASPGLAAS